MTEGVPYLPTRNAEIIFRSAFPKKERSPNKYYTRAVVNGGTETLYRTSSVMLMRIMDKLIEGDKKMLNAVVKLDGDGNTEIVEHSKQEDFFELIDKQRVKL